MGDNRKKFYVKTGKIDYVMVLIVMSMLCFGLVMLFSASAPKALNGGNAWGALLKQSGVAAVGICCAAVIAKMDYRIFRNFAFPAMVVVTVLMYVVPFWGFASHGATRQIEIGPINFQPSEVAKFALILFLATWYSDERVNKLKKNLKHWIPLGVVFVQVIACLLQSHLSASLVILGIGAMLIIAAGLPQKAIIFFGAVALGFLVVGGIFAASYRMDRIEALFFPFENMQGIGWQVVQSLLAVGSGGLFGLGLGQSRQKYNYLPEAQNDYIYAIICEELGFIGGVAVILLFVVFVLRGMAIAVNAEDRFGMFLAFGITSVIGLQMLINIGVVLSVLPSTGMQLPFFSEGGTSLFIMLLAVGVLLSVSKKSKIKKL